MLIFKTIKNHALHIIYFLVRFRQVFQSVFSCAALYGNYVAPQVKYIALETLIPTFNKNYRILALIYPLFDKLFFHDNDTMRILVLIYPFI